MATRMWNGDDRDRIHVDYHGSVGAYRFEEHDHRGFWELTYVRRGRLDHRVGGEPIAQGPGWLTIIREGERHALAGERVEFLNLSFPTAFARALLRLPHPRADALAALVRRNGPLCARLPLGERAAFESELDALGAGHGSAGQTLRLAAVLARALLACHRAANGGRGGDGPAWLARVQAVVETLDEPLPDLAGLRRIAGVSREHLARTCRQRLGLSPSQLINRFRVERAARLLVRGGASVGEIAQAVGFRDRTYLARCFRRHLGASPQAWLARQAAFPVGEARWSARRR